MLQFFETRMGRKFYEADIPHLIRVISELSERQQKTNELLEKISEQMGNGLSTKSK